MARFAYGDSYGGVAQNELAMDAARDNRFFQSLAAQRAAEQLAMQQEQSDLASRFSLMKFLADQKQTRASNLFNRENQQYARSQDLLGYLLKNRELDQKVQHSREQSDLASRDQTYADYGDARKAITEGLLSPDQLPQAFPTLPPTMRSRLAAFHGNLANQEQQLAEMEQGDAAGLNEELSLKRLAQGLLNAKTQAAEAKKGWNWLPGRKSESQIDADLAATTANLQAGRGRGEVELPPNTLSDFLNLVFKNKRLSESVRWNPDQESFEPVPIPRRFALSRPVAAPAPAPTGRSAALLQQAQEAIARGANPAQVIARLRELQAQ